MGNKEKKHACLLARVSTHIQDFEPQLNDLKEYAKSYGYTDFHIVATKESGLLDEKNKVGSNELVDFIEKNRQYKAVFCTEMSRLGRNSTALFSLYDWFVTNKVNFYIKDRNFALFQDDKEHPEAKLMFIMYGYFTESEIKQKKDRFDRARKFYASQGYAVSGKRLFGYDRTDAGNKRKRYILNEQEADVIRLIFDWYLNGIKDKQIANPSIKQITKECISRGFPTYVHSKRNVNKLLKEAGYTGFKITNNKRKLPDYLSNAENNGYALSSMEIRYPPIIEVKIFEDVQNKLKSKNLNADKSSKHVTLLSKLILCPTCSRKYEAQYRMKDKYDKSFYRCTGSKYIDSCSNRNTVGMNLLDNSIWSLIKSDLPELISNLIETNKPVNNVGKLKEEKNNLTTRKSKLKEKAIEEDKRLKILLRNKIGIDPWPQFDKITKAISKEIRQIDERLLRIDTEIVNEKNAYGDPSSIEFISNNLKYIESDKISIKKYIIYCIESILIIHQNKSFTIIKVNFNNLWRHRPFKWISKDSIDDYSTYLFIDKRNTRNIKLVKTFEPFILDNDILIFFSNKSPVKISLDDVFGNSEVITNNSKSTLKYKHNLTMTQKRTIILNSMDKINYTSLKFANPVTLPKTKNY